MEYFIKKAQLLSFLYQRIFKFGISDITFGLSNREVAYEAMFWNRLIPNECRTIIDVGAHTGSVTAALNFLFRPKLIIAIEPNPNIISQLNKRFRNEKNVEIIGKAVTNSTGKTLFYAHSFEAASSMFQIQKDYLNNLGFSEEFKQIEVPSTTLDEIILDYNLDSIDLLKLDCQGSELEILRGAEKSLPMIKMIHTEVLFQTIYEGAPKFCDIHDFLANRGFELRSLHSLCGPKKAIHWADAIYFNTSL